MNLSSVDRVRKALSFKPSDRIPLDFWADKTVISRLIAEKRFKDTEELLKFFNIDFRFIEGTEYKGPELRHYDDGSVEDIWGVRRKHIHIDEKNYDRGTYEHAVYHPLANAMSSRDIEAYEGWPSPDWFDYTKVTEMSNKHSGYAVICGGDRLNRTAQLKPAMYLRGIEQTILDLALNPVIIEAIAEKTVNFFLEYNKRIFENAQGKIDIFFMGDDFGTQNGLIMGLDMWRKLFKPGFKRFIDLAHQYNIKVMHHTCGAIIDLIPEFIDCGLDILQSLQPAAKGMDFIKIKKEFGKYICFQGGIDIQNTMPFGTPDDVKAEVIERIKVMGAGGGYILCTAHNIQADTPTENIFALYMAAEKYGRY